MKSKGLLGPFKMEMGPSDDGMHVMELPAATIVECAKIIAEKEFLLTVPVMFVKDNDGHRYYFHARVVAPDGWKSMNAPAHAEAERVYQEEMAKNGPKSPVQDIIDDIQNGDQPLQTEEENS